MSKKSAVYRNLKRAAQAEKFSKRRAVLKETVMNKDLSPEERFQATLKLAELPRNSAKIRFRNRCKLTGRPRGYYSKFGLARIKLRDLAGFGEIPGLVKSSW